MTSFCVGVIAGSLLSLFLPIVPPFFTLFLLLPIVVIVLWLRWHFCAGILIFICCWLFQIHGYLQAQQQIFSGHQAITGYIAEIPKHYPDYSQFILQLDSGPARGYRLRLNWWQPDVTLQAGQYWRLNTTLRPVTGPANPTLVNKEAQALIDDIIAHGSVQQKLGTELLFYRPDYRQQLVEQIAKVTSEYQTAPLLLALTVGERDFSEQLWQGLQHSALAHLMAISGLHIGLVFGWMVWLCKLIPVGSHAPYLQRAVILLVALSIATVYAWAAGFAIPTVRACFALALVVLGMLQLRRTTYSQFWLVLTATLLLIEPAWVLSKSFWLSILAVAIIFFLLWLQPMQGKSWRQRLVLFFRFHLLMTTAMSLLSLMLFNGSSALALLSNLLFVPWCTLFAIPLLFIALLSELVGFALSSYLWYAADLAFKPLLWWLQWCAGLNSWWAMPDLSFIAVLGLTAALFIWYLQQRKLFLLLTTVAALPMLLAFARPAHWQMHIIDVGQGLAILLQYQQRGILYDAGPRYGQYSATAAQVLPFLRQRGITELDYLILSHNDSDHTGNWPLLQAYYPNMQVIADFEGIANARPCSSLPSEYAGAQLKMLGIGSKEHDNKNDKSCVLLVQIAGWKLLLPGDISQKKEAVLLERYPQLKADVLVLAHHGSNSSSSLPFLHQLAPQLAFNSASLFNPHGHPARQVQQKLKLLSVPLINTAESGAITLYLSEDKLELTRYRQQRIPFWLEKPLGIAETLPTTR